MFIVAGPPGAGKSRAFPVSRFGVESFNADDRAASATRSILSSRSLLWAAPGCARAAYGREGGERGRRERMIEGMAQLRMTEAELARDIHAVLARVQEGVEIVVEQDHRPVAVIKSPVLKGRKISEVIATLEASGASAVIDEDFAGDVEEGVNAHREPWNPPSWE